MTEPTLSPEMQARLAQLSPERRALLEQRLRATAAVPTAGARDETPLAPRAANTIVPLTAGQQLLWELDQAAGGTVAYNVPRVLRVSGALDLEALRRALDALVLRHESLRTRFEVRDGVPRQVVHAAAPVEFAVHDVSGLAPELAAEARARHVQACVSHVFDLGREQLLRGCVVREAEARWTVCLLTHHIVCDEWSRDVTYRDLSALYDAFRAGGDASLPPLSVQYGDFALWQRDALAHGRLATQLDYWRETLAGRQDLALPTDAPRTQAPSFAGARQRRRLGPDVAAGVQDLARAQGVTPFVTLLSAALAIGNPPEDDATWLQSSKSRRNLRRRRKLQMKEKLPWICGRWESAEQLRSAFMGSMKSIARPALRRSPPSWPRKQNPSERFQRKPNFAVKEIEPLIFAQSIRAMKSMRGVPILLVGDAELSEADAETAVALAAQGYLRRPVDAQVLQQEIERGLKR